MKRFGTENVSRSVPVNPQKYVFEKKKKKTPLKTPTKYQTAGLVPRQVPQLLDSGWLSSGYFKPWGIFYRPVLGLTSETYTQRRK